MAATHRAPKQWCLTKTESINTFENWKSNLLYCLSLDANFSPFLEETTTWQRASKSNTTRGLSDDDESVPEATRKTAAQKVKLLDMMLGQIANYCPIISRNTITKSSTSLNSIWQAIRLHYGFQSSGARFLDFTDIKYNPDESYEDLFQRVASFIDDSLMRTDSGVTHHGEKIANDEELSPTLENLIVLTWLRLIHPDLPRLVKQRYGTELRARTLASIKPEISMAIHSLLDEIRTIEESKIMRSNVSMWRKPQPQPYIRKPSRPHKVCPLCKEAKRQHDHFLSSCSYLPLQDKKYMVKARQICTALDSEESEYEDDTTEGKEELLPMRPAEVNRVQIRQSPYLEMFYNHHTVRLTLDSGATSNMMSKATAMAINTTIQATTQSAHQADGSPLNVIGETHLVLTRDDSEFKFDGLVVESLDVDVLAGIPFMEINDIALRPAKHQVVIRGAATYGYGAEITKRSAAHRVHVLRAPPQHTTIWPGDYLELQVPEELADMELALEPRYETHNPTHDRDIWPPPCIISSVSRIVRIPNLTTSPLTLRKHEHFGQVLSVTEPNESMTTTVHAASTATSDPTCSIKIDPDNLLPSEDKTYFTNLTKQYALVFQHDYPGYNGAVGPFQATVNMGPVQPPQRKGRIPQYSRDKLVTLQEKFDELEGLGVFKRPEDIGAKVEYLNPSFLVKKASGGHRLVTAFTEVGRYSKPQPALMPDVESTLQAIGQWQYLIVTDLTSAFYQIPLSKDSYKYCGVATPYKGVRVYVRSAMGMPGSETALEELMSRVLGDLLMDGKCAKLADDLYVGANTIHELQQNWKQVLQALNNAQLRLSPSKTVICPKSTTILGWNWTSGTLSASKHRISSLSTCSKPNTVRAMRSFIGAYKMLGRVLKGCSSVIAPLDDSVAGRASNDKIKWSDTLSTAFKTAQELLSKCQSVTLPRRDDQLWIVTDGAVRSPGIGATLYAMRNDKLHLAGFFSAKLKKHQVSWLPCEVEALSIGVATRHFSPYIIQSTHKTNVLTDSKPCVQSYEKLCRGQFSSSPRVATFLSVVSRYQVSVRHLAGSANMPSDFASRNALDCDLSSCQVCSFIKESEESVVLQSSIDDIMRGHTRPPFASRAAWHDLQASCPDLRRVKAHLLQGTRPSKKVTNVKDVKRYLSIATISSDGLLVVKKQDPLLPSKELIIVPRSVVQGLIMSLHIQLDHPSRHQLKMVCSRQFHALDLDAVIEQATTGCHVCASLYKAPKHIIEQSSQDPPPSAGVSFAADVLKRCRQLVLVIRECTTSYTLTCLIESESASCLRDGIISLCIGLVPLDGPLAVIRTDGASGFSSLTKDESLHKSRLSIEVGRTKNINKNPVAERAVQELEDELLKQDPSGGPVNSKMLAVATARLNSRLRRHGISAREMFLQRSQFDNSQLPINDYDILQDQHKIRSKNHQYSERSKATKFLPPTGGTIGVGDLVYLYSDQSKLKSRPRYLVTSIEGEWCNIKKFSGSQLRNHSYRVKKSECYRVPSNASVPQSLEVESDEDLSVLEDVEYNLKDPTTIPPEIPDTLSTPLSLEENNEVTTDVQTDVEEGTSAPSVEMIDEIVPHDTIRRSSRLRRPPQYLEDYELK